MEKMKRPGYEFVIVAIVVALAVLLSGSLYAGRARVRKSNMLIHELSMLRSSVTLFKMINRTNPRMLQDLATQTYAVDGVTRPFVDHLPKSPDGTIVDPFGNPYRYDSASGWVQSSTHRYERW